jgi:hypothetical protein
MIEKEVVPKLRKPKLMIGWREIVSLPDLDLNLFNAKIDTGARTTALHASNISEIEIDGEKWVEFIPDHDASESKSYRKARVLHVRNITNTSGVPEKRFIIATTLSIGQQKQRIEVSLADRSEMKFPLILGRTALRVCRLTVDSSRSWLVSDKPKKKKES